MITLGEALRAERRRRHERQTTTAARFGISQPSYHRWETGVNQPEPEHYGEIAEFLGLTVEEVWSMVHEGEPPSSLTLVLQELAAVQRDIDDHRARIARLERS